ncbi:MAG: helix-turn-helix transcriptional regulator [Actinomycetes bacterium]|jgi:transcriptional regulator with XRE-family HTH domain|nr:MAG: hypothetical protein DIU60_07370 [Actinomycetota bacterium]
MTEDEWPARLARTVAGQVRAYRELRGMSAAELADACAALGLPISRSAIADLESGRRPTVSVAELLVFARVLHVPPIELLCPVGRADAVEILPGRKTPPWTALRWVSGEAPLPDPGECGAGYLSSPEVELYRESATYAYRLHAEYESACTQAGFRVGAARRAANAAAGDAERAAHLARAAAEERRYRESRRRLREHRERMRREGFVPPPLTTHLPDAGDERDA